MFHGVWPILVSYLKQVMNLYTIPFVCIVPGILTILLQEKIFSREDPSAETKADGQVLLSF